MEEKVKIEELQQEVAKLKEDKDFWANRAVEITKERDQLKNSLVAIRNLITTIVE